MPGFKLDKVRLPEVSFGQPGELPSNWDKIKDDDPHCHDEEPKEFPSDVAALLGFDPTQEIQAGGPGSGRHPEVGKAIDEIHEKFPPHPTNPDERALMVQGKPAVGFQVAEREGRLRLKTIHSDEPKSGAGALVMRRLTKIADKHGATMELTSAPYGEEKGRISHEKLQSFYEGHGFKLEKGYDPALGYMVREPKKDVSAGGPGSGRHPEGGSKYKLPAGLPKVFAKMLLPKNATWQRHKDWKQQAYGGVLVNKRGQFLLREPSKHFDGYSWTFPKGKMNHEQEHPVDVALREVQEETGRHGRILDTLPGNYQTTNSNSNFYVMRSLGNDPSKMDKETWRTHWADYEEAKQLISKSKNEIGRNRDLAILDQAHEHLQRYKRNA